MTKTEGSRSLGGWVVVRFSVVLNVGHSLETFRSLEACRSLCQSRALLRHAAAFTGVSVCGDLENFVLGKFSKPVGILHGGKDESLQAAKVCITPFLTSSCLLRYGFISERQHPPSKYF